MLDRLALEDCVHSGPQMWPKLAQKSDVASTSSSPDPALSLTMPIDSLPPSSESSAPPLRPL